MYYLHGGAGAPNFGDELIARLWLDFLPHNTGAKIVLSGYHQNALDNLFSARYPEVHLTSALSQCQVKCEPNFWGAFIDGYNFFEGPEPTSSRMPESELRVLLATSVFHLHGGGYINTLWPKHAFYLGLAAAIRKKIGCKIIATGIGLTPIQPPPEDLAPKLKEAFAAFDMFEARDNASYDFASKWGGYRGNVVMGYDDVFISEPSAARHGRSNLHISLHSNNYGNKAADSLHSSFVSQFDQVFFWVCHNKDMAQMERLSARLPNIKALSVDELTFNPLPVGENDFVITSRYHPHLMAARIGAKGQYLAVGDYSTIKHRAVVRVGSKFVPLSSGRGNSRTAPMMRAMDRGRILQKRSLWQASIN